MGAPSDHQLLSKSFCIHSADWFGRAPEAQQSERRRRVSPWTLLVKLETDTHTQNRLNHTPFHLHHQDKTLNAYCVPVAHLVASLLRKQPKILRFPSTSSLDSALALLAATQDLATLHQVFKALWLTTWTPVGMSQFHNPTLVYLGLSTLKEGGEFAHPKEVTGTIAKLTRGIQLVILTEFHNMLHKAPTSQTIALFQELQPWIKTGEDSTFSDLTSLQKYASTIANSALSFPKIIFPNRNQDDYTTMLFQGQPISLAQIQEIEHNMEKKIMDIFDNQVLLGLGIKLEYGVLAEDLTNAKPGYCFLDENKALKASTHSLGNAIMEDEKLFQEFMVQDAGGKWSVNVLRARVWLQALAQVELHLLLLVEMRSGSPIRMSELTSTLIRNRNTRVRNLMAVGRHLTIIRQYSKNTNNEQMDRMIPHGLCGFDQDLLVHIHTLARPLAMVRQLLS